MQARESNPLPQYIIHYHINITGSNRSAIALIAVPPV